MKLYPLAWAALLAAPALAFSAGAAPADDALPDVPVVSSAKLSLQDALALALVGNLTLKQTQADAAAAAAAARGAQAQTRPSLSATTYGTLGDSSNILTTSPGVTPQNLFNVPPHGFADQNLMLMVPLLTGGRLSGSAAMARRQGEAALLSVQAARLTVTEAVTESYANAALQQALVNAAQARLTLENEQVRVTQEKVQTGRLAPVSLLREQAEQADAQQGLLAARNNAALRLLDFKTTLGVSPLSQITLSETLDSLSVPIAPLPAMPDALGQAEANRPELAAARRQVEAAQAGVNAALGEGAPQVYGVAMADVMVGQGLKRAGYTVGLTASLPLYDGGQRRADADGAKARLDRARADAQQARQAVDQQAVAAWLTAQTTAAQVQAAGTGVDAARQGYNLAALRYTAGKSVAAERLDALAALTRAQETLAQAKAGFVIARARLKVALGLP